MRKRIILILSLILFISGCATIQRAKRAEELEREVARLNQLIKEKDARIIQLQEKEMSYKRSLEELQKELDEYKKRLKTPEKKTPPLK